MSLSANQSIFFRGDFSKVSSPHLLNNNFYFRRFSIVEVVSGACLLNQGIFGARQNRRFLPYAKRLSAVNQGPRWG
jgi:hypothetical protein